MSRRTKFPAVFCALFALGSLVAPAAIGGTITGRVQARSVTENSGGDTTGAYGSRKYKFLEKVDYGALRDFVVYVDRVEANPTGALPKAIVTQRDGAFVPHVLPIVVGTTVDWPNADDVFHNVFCMSESTPFDLGLYKQGEPGKSVVFPKTGRIEVFCSIHTKMSCIVLVLPNPWFALVSEKGTYSIPNVPPGKYQLRAWHERLPSKTKEIVVPATGALEIDFVLGLGPEPKS